MSTLWASKYGPQTSVCAANLSGSPAVTLSGIAMSSAGLCQSRPERGEVYQKLAIECLSAWVKGVASLTSQQGATTSGHWDIRKRDRWGLPGREAAPQDSELGDIPNNGKGPQSKNTALLEKVETTTWRNVLKCSEHSLKLTSGIKLPSQTESQSPEYADLLLSLFLPFTNWYFIS